MHYGEVCQFALSPTVLLLGFLVLRPRLSRPTVSLQPLQSAVLTASLSAVCVATEYHNEQIRKMTNVFITPSSSGAEKHRHALPRWRHGSH